MITFWVGWHSGWVGKTFHNINVFSVEGNTFGHSGILLTKLAAMKMCLKVQGRSNYPPQNSSMAKYFSLVFPDC